MHSKIVSGLIAKLVPHRGSACTLATLRPGSARRFRPARAQNPAHPGLSSALARDGTAHELHQEVNAFHVRTALAHFRR